jgi:hypothetical protein
VAEGGETLLSRIARLSEEYGVEMHWDSVERLAEGHGVGFAVP